MKFNDCSPGRERLAESAVCSVDRCACGTLHVSFGPFTLRIDASAIEAIWSTLGAALEQIQARARAQELPRSALTPPRGQA